jgi:hypothetical protein
MKYCGGFLRKSRDKRRKMELWKLFLVGRLFMEALMGLDNLEIFF